MKVQLLYILTTSFIYLSKCQNIIIPTNYTLSFFNSIDMDQMTCKTDNDCPQYAKCEKYTTDDKVTHSVCRFGNFLCPEKPEEFCHYVDTNIWNLDNESINKEYPKETKPILKTCPRNKVNALFKCRTNKCSKNEDCFSNMCYKESCIVNKDKLYNNIYRCSGNGKNYYMRCGKQRGMKCDGNSECYSENCKDGYCGKQGLKKWVKIIIFLGIICLLFLPSIYEYFTERKEKDSEDDEDCKKLKDNNN
ncbi:hypothetical protein BCR32DRAFT_289261 [Anaeromyces robustus]|uniref:Dickkopf N-terminal cysteine-rich domain-containing protein n=1 Tax=Anaeromyces robustus TaxID=1754192 RepID=A0A1Y1XPE8_9FUNG|nr:hypothetical protein BCR32DRAFT_289261 [Anaeromyces robustus]|eukprot:ORX87620.1 hypothetical protein BCR32DRAFT_289261 [Anaeromyces robustus]